MYPNSKYSIKNMSIFRILTNSQYFLKHNYWVNINNKIGFIGMKY